jgi:purine-binding chemotaxis protein CheW
MEEMEKVKNQSAGIFASDVLSGHLLIRQGDRHLGINILDIVEIIRMVAINSIPESSEEIAGVVNYRGEIMPIINLWTLLGQETPKILPDMGIVVLSCEEQVFGMVVEEIRGVEDIEIKARPDELSGDVVWPLISGVSYMENMAELLLVLNVARLRQHQKRVSEELEK